MREALQKQVGNRLRSAFFNLIFSTRISKQFQKSHPERVQRKEKMPLLHSEFWSCLSLQIPDLHKDLIQSGSC